MFNVLILLVSVDFKTSGRCLLKGGKYVTVLTSKVIIQFRCKSRSIQLLVTIQGSNSKFNPLAAKLMVKYYVSFDFRPIAMEFSTRHLALCNCIYLSGCNQFKQAGTRSNQLDLVPVYMV